jgi:hypothetical protein
LDFQGLHVAPETLQTGITTNAHSSRVTQTEGTALKQFMAYLFFVMYNQV